jgi:hypothetical protein
MGVARNTIRQKRARPESLTRVSGSGKCAKVGVWQGLGLALAVKVETGRGASALGDLMSAACEA